ncbi:embryonic protein UVS.2-like, partial [Penaeus monodon]|uniref:embryonic protein UVS.2-like n=1 Tax=Penaeus monodon TaxID=6687 RepID=UPI0018A70960
RETGGPDADPEQLAAILNRKAINDVTRFWPDVNGFPHIPIPLRMTWLTKQPSGAPFSTGSTTPASPSPRSRTPALENALSSSATLPPVNSYVGMVSGSGGQIINVPVWCEQSFGSLVHEVGHALGCWHEQSRSDRDEHILILTQNIISSAVYNFNLMTTNNYGVPYDYPQLCIRCA